MILGWIFSMGYRLEHNAERMKVLSFISMPEKPLEFFFPLLSIELKLCYDGSDTPRLISDPLGNLKYLLIFRNFCNIKEGED